MSNINLQKYAAELKEDLPQLKDKKVMVVGDIGVDEYIWGSVKRISPEAPVPIVDVTKQESALGLSANVAANINSLGGQALLVGVVGFDEGANTLKKLLKKYDVSSEYLIFDSQRPTIRKVRILGENQQVVRIDFEKKKYIDEKIENTIFQQVKNTISTVDIVLLQDYAKGLLTENLCQKMIKLAKENNKQILVDPHRNTPLHFYKGCTLFKPNFDESVILSGLIFNKLIEPADMVEQIAVSLKNQLLCESVIVTLGKNGMLIDEKGTLEKVPTVAKEVFDVTGAGDTVIASLSLAISSDWSLTKACVLANFAAGIVVGKMGCVPCSKDELLNSLENFKNS